MSRQSSRVRDARVLAGSPAADGDLGATREPAFGNMRGYLQTSVFIAYVYTLEHRYQTTKPPWLAFFLQEILFALQHT